MKLHRVVFACIVGLALALGGCGAEEGDSCEKPDECGGDLLCAEIVVCEPDSETCPGICGLPCETDADCDAEQQCGDTAGGMRICLSSRDIGAP
jgi:hypothetical protein